MTAPSDSESLWAEHGLTGLVLFALFGLIAVFLRVISKKDAGNQSFIQNLLDDERAERKATRKDNAANSDKLAKAISGLADELRKKP